jgi:hypothetical protein
MRRAQSFRISGSSAHRNWRLVSLDSSLPGFGPAYRVIVNEIKALEIMSKFGLVAFREEVTKHHLRMMMTVCGVETSLYIFVGCVNCCCGDFQTPRLEAMLCQQSYVVTSTTALGMWSAITF